MGRFIPSKVVRIPLNRCRVRDARRFHSRIGVRRRHSGALMGWQLAEGIAGADGGWRRRMSGASCCSYSFSCSVSGAHTQCVFCVEETAVDRSSSCCWMVEACRSREKPPALSFLLFRGSHEQKHTHTLTQKRAQKHDDKASIEDHSYGLTQVFEQVLF
ncbi:hypothetical protein E3N88_17934 [Mikania micrantha]|uniref:Uncharacterized protein n=1 Tax=Mikania micrantha TaxID=192012 RepID=A0A5N6NVZ9_9ASTR|nr:hypothetical protein E3N88_17934 [Mikania micrantha]